MVQTQKQDMTTLPAARLTWKGLTTLRVLEEPAELELAYKLLQMEHIATSLGGKKGQFFFKC